MDRSGLLPVHGFVLAGGKSSRMGRDKALLELAGEPLIRHAVKKLQRVCSQVRVLSDNPELAAYAPMVRDIHPGCGPMGGMEAALLDTSFEWNLFLAVDMPFMPSAFIRCWVRRWLREAKRNRGAQVRMFTVDGRSQPGFCLLHRDVGPFLSAALERGQYKLLPTLEAIGRELAARKGLPPDRGFCNVPMAGFRSTRGSENKEACYFMTGIQEATQHLWFANLNTPEEFAAAERNAEALDT